MIRCYPSNSEKINVHFFRVLDASVYYSWSRRISNVKKVVIRVITMSTNSTKVPGKVTNATDPASVFMTMDHGLLDNGGRTKDTAMVCILIKTVKNAAENGITTL